MHSNDVNVDCWTHSQESSLKSLLPFIEARDTMRAPLLEPDGSQNERPAVNSPSRFAQYHASVLRCFKLKARKPVWCAAEILLPIAFVGLLAWLSTLVTAKDHDGGTSTQSSFAHQSRGLVLI